MIQAIKKEVTVQPGGVIAIRSPELKPGDHAEVIVILDKEAQPHADAGLRSRIGKARGSFASPQDVDAFVRQEREAWE